MTYVITEACLKDNVCVDLCEVNCIHGEEDDPQMYIDPAECIDCGICEVECPAGAIFPADSLPAEWKHFAAVNEEYFAAKA